MSLVVGVLALQGAFVEHISRLRRAADNILTSATPPIPVAPGAGDSSSPRVEIIEVRTATQLARCDALVLPGGESTAISLIAERTGLLEPLRDFVKVQRRPVWGTCAGLILLAESANRSKASGQELIGGLDVRVQRNYFGRQVESFEADLPLRCLPGDSPAPFRAIFIRAPVVEQVLLHPTTTPRASDALSTTTIRVEDHDEEKLSLSPAGVVLAPPRQHTSAPVEVMGRLPGRARALREATATARDLGEEGDIIAVQQGNVFGTAFHPELTDDVRIHEWWLKEVMLLAASRDFASSAVNSA